MMYYGDHQLELRMLGCQRSYRWAFPPTDTASHTPLFFFSPIFISFFFNELKWKIFVSYVIVQKITQFNRKADMPIAHSYRHIYNLYFNIFWLMCLKWIALQQYGQERYDRPLLRENTLLRLGWESEYMYSYHDIVSSWSKLFF